MPPIRLIIFALRPHMHRLICTVCLPFVRVQKQAMLVRQLEEELRMRMRQPNIEMQQQMEAIFAENEHLTREIAILRDTIKVYIHLFI